MAPLRFAPQAVEPWFGTPMAVGLLMLFLPPLAVTLVWCTPRFDATARMALTLFGALVTALMGVVAIAAVTT